MGWALGAGCWVQLEARLAVKGERKKEEKIK
jgi:hypothetical protein